MKIIDLREYFSALDEAESDITPMDDYHSDSGADLCTIDGDCCVGGYSD